MPSLNTPLTLPCGAVLKNRIVKSAMSDSLGDGKGNPTESQISLYERWQQGGVAASVVGEVQIDSRYPEKPGNLVLSEKSDVDSLRVLASRSTMNGSHLWAQLGHAGALTHVPISMPKGPSALDLEGLKCDQLSKAEIQNLPSSYAQAASLAKSVGFTGVQIHAGHGFLLSQFLSPLFNKREDEYGGSIENRCRLMLSIIDHVRKAVGVDYPIAVRINSTDMLEGGLTEEDSLSAIGLLNASSVDLIDISGGTYFPGAKASSDSSIEGPYFLNFAQQAKSICSVPLMVTGGIKKVEHAVHAIESGTVDIVGIGRAFVLDPALASNWLKDSPTDPIFPRFDENPEGGITAWYTMRITAIGEGRDADFSMDLHNALSTYEERDAQKSLLWSAFFQNRG